MKNFIFKINRALAAKTKIFSILAAAIIALSFASCEKVDPGMKFFHLKAVVTDTSVVLSVTPADTSVYYGLGLYPSYYFKSYPLDTLLKWDIEELQWEVDEYGMTLEQMVEDEDLYKGPFGPLEITEIPLNYACTFLAYEVLENNGELSIGRVASKNFTTKKMEVVGEIDLGALDAGVLDTTYYAKYGFYTVAGWNDDVEVWVSIYDDNFKGSFTYADIEPEMSGVWTADDNVERYLVDAKITTTFKEADQSGKANGWVVAENGIKYKFSFEYKLEDGRAPARRAIKKDFFKEEERQPKTLTLKRFRK